MDGNVRNRLVNELNGIRAGIDHAEVSRDPLAFIEVRKRLYEFSTGLEAVIDHEIARALAEVVVKEETSPSGEVLFGDQQADRA